MAAWQSIASLDVAGITADSREVVPGDLFVALPGTMRRRPRFIADAVARGAVAVLAPHGTEWPPGVPPRPLILDPEPRRRLAQMAAALAGPQPETVVAVTGTNGKTSTVEFLRQIWAADGASGSEPRHARRDRARLRPGTRADHARPGDAWPRRWPAWRAPACQRAALEASSHGLDQFRLDGVRLAAAGFTNLTRDHLDYHGTEAAYRAAKLRLFEDLLPRRRAGGGECRHGPGDPGGAARHRHCRARVLASRATPWGSAGGTAVSA